MKTLFILSFISNFFKIRFKFSRSLFYDYVKYSLVLLVTSILYTLAIGEIKYIEWMRRELMAIILLMFISLMITFKLRFENFLIRFIFILNILHLIQMIIGIKFEFYYVLLDLLQLPGLDRETTLYSEGLIGGVITQITGISFNRISIFFDQPSTYFIMITLLSYVLIFQNKLKFALYFFIVGFLASPTKFGLVMVFPFFILYYLRKKNNFIKNFNYLSVFAAFSMIAVLPPLIGFLGNKFMNGQVILDYYDTFSARIYWTWLIGNGVFPWELIDYCKCGLSNDNCVFAIYDGTAAKIPFIFASIVAWFIAPKIRHFSLAMILTSILTIQYGVSLTIIWLFLILSLVIQNLEHEKSVIKNQKV